MSEFKGTPGPWERDKFGNVVHGQEDGYGRKESVRVSGVALPGRVTPEYEANTQLVAAAPELLEALIEARVWVQGWNAAHESEESEKALIMCNKAIGRALGQ